jgi:hypothetical protein
VLAHAWADGGGTVVGLAPTGRAADELRRSVGTRTDTIAKLLVSLDADNRPPWVEAIDARTLLIVDEAGAASTANLDRVVRVSGSGAPASRPVEGASGLRVAVVASLWHTEVMDGLLEGARRALRDAGVADVTEVRVPGSFELTVARATRIGGSELRVYGAGSAPAWPAAATSIHLSSTHRACRLRAGSGVDQRDSQYI